MGSKVKEGEVSIRYKPTERSLKRTLYNIGFMGIGKYSSYNSPNAHETWRGIFRRCYCPKFKEKLPTYDECSVAPEWHNFQNFAEWFENNSVSKWKVDKDILFKGNKIYSPETCCFVPHSINMKFIVPPSNKLGLPRGVQKLGSKYLVEVRDIFNKRIYKRFENVKDAENFWKLSWTKSLSELLEIHKDELKTEVYLKLKSYL